MDNIVKFMVPENYQMEEMTITFKRIHLSDIKTIEEPKLLPSPVFPRIANKKRTICQFCHLDFKTPRSRWQHERQCLQNPNKEEHSKGRFKPENTAKKEACQFCGKSGFKRLSTHESQCKKNPAYKPWTRTPKSVNIELPDKVTKLSPWQTATQKIDNLFGKKFQLPDDFNHDQKFKVGAYVWHDAWKLGVITEISGPIDDERSTVKFGNIERYFLIEGCRAMYNAMMNKAKNEV